MTETLARIEAETIRRLCVVPEALTVTEWADKFRMLPETSTAPGPYDSGVIPYARRPQDCMADPDVPMVVLCWASQTTKSTCIENALAYRIVRQPTPMIVVQPKIEHAEGWAKERLVPMILATPVLRNRVRLGKSSDSTLRYKRFPGGFVFVASAASATELASRATPVLLLDEVDRFEVIPGEGNPVEIALRRQGAADVGIAILTSTPRDAETTMIWPYLEAGTFELYHVPCPHCGHAQPLAWKNLVWDPGLPETAAYRCDGCAALIEEHHKRAMLAAGTWVATNPGAAYPSFHLNALYSPFGKTSWASLAQGWIRAQGKPADLQVFINTCLAELWEETGEGVSLDAITQRLEPAEEGIVPAGVGVLTVGVDVQDNRIEYSVWGWGAGLESWYVAHGVLDGDPEKDLNDPNSPWHQLLRDVLAREWPHAAGGTIRIAAGLVDSGYATTAVYKVMRRARRKYRVHASKGQGGAGIPILGKPSQMKHAGVLLYPVGTDQAKTEFLRSQLAERTVGPGYVHLPDWLSTDVCEQLVAEQRKRRMHRGRILYEWRKRTADSRNEALDCRVYARAALELLGPTIIRSLGERAAKRAMIAVAAAEPAPATPMRQRPRARRSGFVNNY